MIAESQHRGHAIVEQVIADLKAGPLAHLPSGRFQANAAWLVAATIAFNLTRAIGVAAGGQFTRAEAEPRAPGSSTFPPGCPGPGDANACTYLAMALGDSLADALDDGDDHLTATPPD